MTLSLVTAVWVIGVAALGIVLVADRLALAYGRWQGRRAYRQGWAIEQQDRGRL